MKKKELSKFGKILVERGISQRNFIDLARQRTGVELSKSRVSQYVNKKNDFLTSETLKILAYTLQVSIDDIVEGWTPPSKRNPYQKFMST